MEGNEKSWWTGGDDECLMNSLGRFWNRFFSFPPGSCVFFYFARRRRRLMDGGRTLPGGLYQMTLGGGGGGGELSRGINQQVIKWHGDNK